MLIGTAIFVFNEQEFFGGDAMTYDFYGSAQLNAWGGDKYAANLVTLFVGKGEGSGWGMVYFVAAVYGVVGRQHAGDSTGQCRDRRGNAIIIFLCAQEVFANVRVARLAAFAVAFYPSLVLWSSQGLKDAPIVFLLALSILATLRLGQEIQRQVGRECWSARSFAC